MDEIVKSYLFSGDEAHPSDEWSYIFELAAARNIAVTSSSTRENQVGWGQLPIIYGEELHHEEI